ncbi:MAG TPA: thioredoxin domain-containing protein [Rubricoccaceae bacterium]|nr:thioredoxin domain-containing protein [Rubricoccaceae bacterium]
MPNRLAQSSSPYLLQHADNPVDWRPWGDEAFEEARRLDRPVFLSIGYATCHWCHVMAHESFEDEEVARLMNDAFVNVKMDREEHPDVDAVYMAACQAVTGHGGWPLTVLLTPDRQPFFVATYLPKESRSGRLGMLDLVPRVQQLWAEEREGLHRSAEDLTGAVRGLFAERAAGQALTPEVLDRAFTQLRARFDAEFGGFGGAPKFPTAHVLLFLLRYWKRAGEGQALGMVEKTLRAMRRGGLWDHVGYGFHRYSTDQRWLLPHFEKMLYDQAMATLAAVETARASGDAWYRTIAEQTLTYVERDLSAPEGGFFSAEDADSLNREGHMEEGAFYVWTEDELSEILGPDDFRFARAIWATVPEGNFLEEATRRLTGANILHHPEPLPDLAVRMGMGEGALRDRIEALRQPLFIARSARPRPLLDDKVLTDWNGLMIAAFSRAARAFGNPDYAARAARAADFLLQTMRTPDGGLYHRYRNGETGLPGLLDDYAFLVWGLIEVYQAAFDERHLAEALALHDQMRERFGDPAGGYFTSEAGRADLIARPKEFYDGAIPSGNAVAMQNGYRLARMTGRTELEQEAERVGAAAAEIAVHPASHAYFMVAADFAIGPSIEVVIAGERGAEDTTTMLDRLGRVYTPNAVTLLRAPGEGPAPIAALAPFTEAQTARGGQATAYVCQNQACQQPTTDPNELVRQVS